MCTEYDGIKYSACAKGHRGQKEIGIYNSNQSPNEGNIKFSFKMVVNGISPAVLAYTPPDPPLKEFTPPRDRALFADPAKKSLLAQATAVEEINPNIGTELKGVQLSKLTADQKDELALLVAEVKSETISVQ